MLRFFFFFFFFFLRKIISSRGEFWRTFIRVNTILNLNKRESSFSVENFNEDESKKNRVYLLKDLLFFFKKKEALTLDIFHECSLFQRRLCFPFFRTSSMFDEPSKTSSRVVSTMPKFRKQTKRVRGIAGQSRLRFVFKGKTISSRNAKRVCRFGRPRGRFSRVAVQPRDKLNGGRNNLPRNTSGA